MRIYGHVLSEDFVNFWEVPNLLLQKFPAEEFTATTKLKVVAKADGQQSGLIVMGLLLHWSGEARRQIRTKAGGLQRCRATK